MKDIDKVIDEIEELSVEADAIEASIQTQDFDLDAKIKYQEELLAELMRQKQEKVRQAKKYIKQQEKYLKELETQRQVCQDKSEELGSLVESAKSKQSDDYEIVRKIKSVDDELNSCNRELISEDQEIEEMVALCAQIKE